MQEKERIGDFLKIYLNLGGILNKNEYEKFIAEIFNSYKCKEVNDMLRFIPVYNNKKECVAYLRPVTKDYKYTLPLLSSYMTKWRNENQNMYTIFQATIERTEYYLENFIINKNDRILFVILTIDYKFIGYIGYATFDFNTKTAEIDSVMRGEKSNIKGLMTFCLNALIWWGKEHLKLANIELQVFKNNEKAISLYTRCGFKTIMDIPMYKEEKENEIIYRPIKKGEQMQIDRYAQLMRYISEDIL